MQEKLKTNRMFVSISATGLNTFSQKMIFIFYAKMPKINWIQPLKREYLMVLIHLHDHDRKLNIITLDSDVSLFSDML